MEAVMKIEQVNGVDMVSTITVAEELGIQHKNLLETIYKYLPEIENAFGRVAFKTDTDYQQVTGIERKALAYLTEDQSLFVGTLSRNSQQVVQFKARLVQAFQAARKFIKQVAAPLSKEETIMQAMKYLQADVESLKEQNKLLEGTIKQQAPKVEYVEKVLNAANLIASSVVAADFGKSAEWLHKELKSRHVMWKVNGVWVLTTKYSGKGYTQTKTHPYTDSMGNQRTSIQTYWTEKGRSFLHEILKEFLTEKAA